MDDPSDYNISFYFDENGLLSRQEFGNYKTYYYKYEKGEGNAALTWHTPEEFIFIKPDQMILPPDFYKFPW